MKIHSGNLETLPADIPQVQTFQRLTQEFPVEGTTASLVVRAPASERSAVTEALRSLDHDAVATPSFVESGRDPVRVSADGTTSVLELAIPFEESNPKVDRAIESLRTDLAPAALQGLHATYAVGGDAARSGQDA
jgi:RND superfamily putative drug exporter